jgi:hypothetical protein
MFVAENRIRAALQLLDDGVTLIKSAVVPKLI